MLALTIIDDIMKCQYALSPLFFSAGTCSIADRTKEGGEKGITYSLAERSALADGNLVTLLNTEGGRDVRRHVLVPLLVTRVLGNVVEVFAADDDGSVHLGGNDGAGQDPATDGDQTSEGALLV